jgi:hypothetical protein
VHGEKDGQRAKCTTHGGEADPRMPAGVLPRERDENQEEWHEKDGAAIDGVSRATEVRQDAEAQPDERKRRQHRCHRERERIAVRSGQRCMHDHGAADQEHDSDHAQADHHGGSTEVPPPVHHIHHD